MKIPDLIKFSFNDFPDAPAWWPKFLERLNPILENLTTALRHLTIDENCEGAYRELEVEKPTETLTIETGLKARPRDVQIVWSDHSEPVFLTWQPVATTKIAIRFSSSVPLTAPIKVRLRLLV